MGKQNTDPMIASMEPGRPASRSQSMRAVGTDAERDQAMIDTWKEMSKHMVAVVRTIQKNEINLNRSIRYIVGSVFSFTILATIGGSLFLARVDSMLTAQDRRLGRLERTTSATMMAVSAGSKAIAIKVQADTSLDPEKDQEAGAAAREAVTKAEEAEKVGAESRKASEKASPFP